MARSTIRQIDKSQAIRTKIAETAVQLFLKEGFQETTVDTIAAAVGVSRRSVFRYFATKEEMALSWTTVTGPDLVKQLNELQDSSLIDPVQAAISAVTRHVNQNLDLHAVSLAVGQLINSTPSLKAKDHEKYLIWEELLANAMIAHGTSPTHSRMAAALALAGLRLAVDEWLANQGRESLADLLAAAYQPFIKQT